MLANSSIGAEDQHEQWGYVAKEHSRKQSTSIVHVEKTLVRGCENLDGRLNKVKEEPDVRPQVRAAGLCQQAKYQGAGWSRQSGTISVSGRSGLVGAYSWMGFR